MRTPAAALVLGAGAGPPDPSQARALDAAPGLAVPFVDLLEPLLESRLGEAGNIPRERHIALAPAGLAQRLPGVERAVQATIDRLAAFELGETLARRFGILRRPGRRRVPLLRLPRGVAGEALMLVRRALVHVAQAFPEPRVRLGRFDHRRALLVRRRHRDALMDRLIDRPRIGQAVRQPREPLVQRLPERDAIEDVRGLGDAAERRDMPGARLAVDPARLDQAGLQAATSQAEPDKRSGTIDGREARTTTRLCDLCYPPRRDRRPPRRLRVTCGLSGGRIMPDGDGGSLRLTYAQLAEARGISKASAERLVRNRKWPRLLGNDGVAIVIVPPGEAAPGASPGSWGGKPGRRRPPRNPPPDHAPDPLPDFRGMIEAAVAPIRAQLDHERARADQAEETAAALRAELVDLRMAEQAAANLAEYGTAQAADLRKRLEAAEQRASDERNRADRAETRADEERNRTGAVEQRASATEAAERIAHAEATGLRAELDARREWSLARRLRWALRRR